ncbi:hypothetical protein QP166_15055 [Sphingomonas sp. LR60]|jgi:hypothetical protein|uniref:hypothetical protein n=1 Tax=Sphingomonas sp. LR60 TaxID=3050233 RepID=UPI002FE3E6FB
MMATTPLIEARNALAGWEMDGKRPFAVVNSVAPAERSRDMLHEATAILTVMASACFDADAVAQRGSTSEFKAVNPTVMAGALNGVATLVDFATFLLED